ncbi:MAG: hypothetical protein ABW063_08505 [Caulobacter sp.]
MPAVASHSPQHSQMAQAWYAGRANDFPADTAAERRQRLAFLAAKGTYFLARQGRSAHWPHPLKPASTAARRFPPSRLATKPW